MKSFEIYYRHLTKEAQKDLCEALNTTPDNENWEIVPLAIIEREED